MSRGRAPTRPPRSGERLSRVVLFARLIKIEHSVFALPFAYAGAFLAAAGMPGWHDLVWVTIAMVGARSAAMALNRLIDAGLDARNPRTARRELPAGLLGRGEVWVFTFISLAVLVVASVNLSPPCRYLWPIPVAAFVIYPYLKRVTWFCHYGLGLTLGIAPAAAWVAVAGEAAPAAWLLFFAVGLWVGGFDVIYGIFDVDFDRAYGVHSLAVAVGERRALGVALLSHAGALVLLGVVGVLSSLGLAYWGGLLAVAVLLAWPHVEIARRGVQEVGMRFMTVNGAVGLLYGVVVVVAVLAE